MIGPKQAKPTKAQERAAYDATTARDEGKCVRCGWCGNTQRDHRQNRDGFNTVPSNLQLLCGPHGDEPGCHLWKTRNPAAAIEEGFACPRWARPEWWPAWRLGVGWVLYFDAPDPEGRWWTEITDATATLLMREGKAE